MNGKRYYQRSYQNRFPRWITAKFASRCGRCRTEIAKGAKLYWYPVERQAHCKACKEQVADQHAEQRAVQSMERASGIA
jgi:hypothetical protein